MVLITREDLVEAQIPVEDIDELMECVQEDSDEDEDSLEDKLASLSEPIVQLDESFPNTVLVAGVPKVAEDRLDKLCQVILKKVSHELKRKGGEGTEDEFEIFMPFGEDGVTRGLAFCTFPCEFRAQHAARVLNGYIIDQKHVFTAAMFDNFDEVIARDENYRAPISSVGFTRENLRWWLTDSRGRDQFVLRYGSETTIYSFDPMESEACNLMYDGHREKADSKVWTDLRVQWSPHGSYLATFHRPGVALWGDETFEKKTRFEHADVKCIEFSPMENYIITWDGSPTTLGNSRAVKIWNVMTGRILRQFPTPNATPRGNEFPHFLFSHDDAYVAMICDGGELCIYQMDPKGATDDDDPQPVSILRRPDGTVAKCPGPVDRFEWSPTENIISIWITGSKDAPGRLLLIEIPTLRELNSKNVYNVKGAIMHWQPKGDFLCLRTIVYKKTGKKGRKESTQLEIFRMRERDIPVDNVQLKDIAMQLHWESGFSKRFALIVQEENTCNQLLRFYRVCDASESVETNKRDTVMTHEFNMSDFMNFFRWSPFGSYFMLAALGVQGTIMFCHLNEQDRVEILHQGDHLMCNEIRWSPCGRFVSTAVQIPISISTNETMRLENSCGFCIWTFQGKLLHMEPKEKFYQFLWRPQPPSLLRKEKIEEIKKKMKDYSKRYEAHDERVFEERRNIYIKQRSDAVNNFVSTLNRLQESLAQHPAALDWQEAAEEFDARFDWESKEEIIEEQLDTKQEFIG